MHSLERYVEKYQSEANKKENIRQKTRQHTVRFVFFALSRQVIHLRAQSLIAVIVDYLVQRRLAGFRTMNFRNIWYHAVRRALLHILINQSFEGANRCAYVRANMIGWRFAAVIHRSAVLAPQT